MAGVRKAWAWMLVLGLGAGCASSTDPAGDAANNAAQNNADNSSQNNSSENNSDENNSEENNSEENNSDENNSDENNSSENNEGCSDEDRDSYAAGEGCDEPLLDCDDTEGRRNPGAEELCDGLDNDCDEEVDEGVSGGACRLTQGVCAGAKRECLGEEGFADCDGADYGGAYVEVEDGAGDPDVCDGMDNDCDGQTDEGCPCQPGEEVPCGLDEGACRLGTQRCEGGRFGACEGSVEPSDEVCDGQDNDCDGEADEDLSAPDCEAQDGVCAGSTKVCEGARGWSSCGAAEYGQRWTQDEDGANDLAACDGLDNDCDGQADEGCGCAQGEERPCGLDVGACQPGVQACEGGQFGACRGEVTGSPEACDGVDNDCDGETDEGLTPPACGLTMGVCQGAEPRCEGEGGWGACDAELYGPQFVEVEDPDLDASVCDGLDNDCDGQTDEGCDCVDGDMQVCGSNIGACLPGVQVCEGGRFGVCMDQVPPAVEVCDGQDNDCDSATDEGIAEPDCALQRGVCAGAKKVCGGAEGFLTCTAQEYGPAYEEEERSCDRRDNDCDGLVDEGCECVDGDTQRCGSDEGVCEAGLQTCAGGRFGACEGEVVGSQELCDGVDNDCDGASDEDAAAPDCALTQGVCAGAKQTCGGERGWRACTGAEYGPRYDGAEETRCDGLDNDCDGQVDEQCECAPDDVQVCGSDTGACVAGLQRCVGGSFAACEGEVRPGRETCDALDNDCDGATDEELFQACALTRGVCAGARVACEGGAFGACGTEEYGPLYEAEESALSCDGFDNDCDGQVDEACAPPAVVISEVLYDEVGSDDGDMLFFELFAAPGTALGGLTLEAVNGSGGAVYKSWTLPNRAVPFNGAFLIVDERAGGVLRDIADLTLTGIDLQNGPDALRLVWNKGGANEAVLDAVGYGTFGVADVFAGEGTAAAGVRAGESLTRDAFGADTNNNSVDFQSSARSPEGRPTPGGYPLSRLHINLSWGTDGNDLDLHLQREGAAFRSDGDCYWLNRNPQWGSPESLLDDPRLDRDDVDGFGPEYMDLVEPAPGRYLVQIDVWRTPAPVPTQVTIFVDGGGEGSEFTFTRDLADASVYWAVAEIVVSPEGAITVEARDEVSAEPFAGP